ncbi:MAG: phosphatidate cytidylyltransferase [Spirochaetia bacterium]|nr:phosphatidate cytidylyltransferase [Spirochaetia bacterium]
MSNFGQRLLLFIIGLPLLLAIVVFFDPFMHAGWAVVVIVVTFLAARETVQLFTPAVPPLYFWVLPILSAGLPLVVYVELFLGLSFSLLNPLLIVSISIILISELFRWKADHPQMFTLNSVGLISAVIYPGFFLVFTIRFLEFDYPLAAIMLFLLVNFSNDTFAYIFGKLFGKNSPHVVPVSPRKTRIGFLGGFAGSLLTGSVFYLIAPHIFAAPFLLLLPFFLIIGLCADIGDLIESAYKRGAAKKDSGSLMPGRGGLLDSIDSLLFSAPFFYYIGTILLK